MNWPEATSEKIGQLICYSQLTGEWPKTEALIGILESFRCRDVVLSISWILTVIQAWRRVESNHQDRLVRDYVLPTWATKFPRSSNRFCFSRYSLLWLMRQAFTYCPADGPEMHDRVDLEKLGMACLIANDLSTYNVERRLQSHLEIAANTLCLTDVFPYQEFDRDIARTRYILTEVARQAPQARLQAVPQLLETALGFGIEEYSDLAMATAIRSMTADTRTIEAFVAPGIRASHFETTAVDCERADQFLCSISASEDAFRHKFAENPRDRDITLLRQFPLLHFPNVEFAILDAGFVLDKAGRGLFWTALKNLPKGQRAEVLGQWGELFEFYVNRVLMEVKHPGRSVFPNPKFADGGEALDCCVMEKGILIAIETKVSTLRADVRYSDDPDLLKAELEKRFVLGDEDGKKGLAQLATFLDRFRGGEQLVDGQQKPIASVKDIYKIIPVLVHFDTALRTFRMNHYLSDRLKGLVERTRKPIITPLALVPVSEVEVFQAFLDELLLSDILESHVGRLRNDPTAVFFAGQVPLLSGKVQKLGPTQRRLNQILRDTVGRLFPGQTIPDSLLPS